MSSAPERVEGGPDRRKLVAVVHADIVGYSRLIGLDDTGTLERLRALRRNLIDPAIAEHGGRIVNIAGDALLVVFDSVDGAVRSALAIQQQVPTYEADQNADRRIRFRIGINIGDAIPDGFDLHGVVVNVAARLQAECPPDAVCVSRAVHDHMQGRLDIAFEALGSLNLKNIARPVEAFVLRLAAATTPKSVERSLIHGTGEVLPLPDRPSIAVLPFANLSGDPEEEHFSEGVADDIITELSRKRSLFVIARNSSFTYKGRTVDVKLVGRELGVRYVVEGSVRRGGDRFRVSAQLIDAVAGNHVWAERYDRKLTDVFAVQDEITAAVTAAVGTAIAGAEQQRALRKPPENLGAWEAYQHGLWHLGKSNPSSNEQAKEFFKRAIALDATFVAAYGKLALTYHAGGALWSTYPLAEAVNMARTWAERGIEIDPNDAEAQAMMAFHEVATGNRDAAWERISLAIARNPNSDIVNGVKGLLLTFNGQPSDGREAYLAALRVNPYDVRSPGYLTQIAASYYFEHDYASAVVAAKRAAARHGLHPHSYRWMAAALGQLGWIDEAREALRNAIEMSPETFERYVRSRPAWFRPEDHEHMLDGLRKAGWQG